MTNPVARDPTARGTITNHPVTSMASHAALIVSATSLRTAVMPRTRYASAAPIHPTEDVRCTASASLRTGGDTVTGLARSSHHGLMLGASDRAVAGSQVAARSVLAAQAGE